MYPIVHIQKFKFQNYKHIKMVGIFLALVVGKISLKKSNESVISNSCLIYKVA